MNGNDANMNPSISNLKRKKRKTRKCLNEMRKRCRPISCYSENHELFENTLKKSSQKENPIQLKSTITSNRLTLQLGMFAKTVRSETITRPMLKDEGKAYVYKEDLNKVIKNKLTTDKSNFFVKSLNHITNVSPTLNKEDQEKETESDDIFVTSCPKKQNYRTVCFPEKCNLDSPIKETLQIDDTSVSSTPDKENPVNSSISQKSPDSCCYILLYEDFMHDIPLYLKKHAPDLTKNNIVIKTKQFLQNIYLKNYHKSKEISQNINGDYHYSKKYFKSQSPLLTDSNILENPIEYIKQNHFNQLQYKEELPKSTDAQPLPSSITPSCLTIINHTPEYIYYARKLNQ